MTGAKKSEESADNPGDYTFEIGTIAGFKGLKGEMKLSLKTNFDLIEDIEDVRLVWQEDRNAGLQTAKAVVKDIKQEGKNFLLSLHDFPDRSSVEHFLGAKVYTQKSQLRNLDQNEWWIEDLIGMEAYTTGGTRLGVVCAVYGEASHLLEILTDPTLGENGKHLVPFVKELVPVVDIAGKRLEIVNLPGLFTDSGED